MADAWEVYSLICGVLVAVAIVAATWILLVAAFRRTGGHTASCLWCDREWDISSPVAYFWHHAVSFKRHRRKEHSDAAERWDAAMARGGRDAAMQDFFDWRREQRAAPVVVADDTEGDRA